jgi:hypothetical protein
VLKRSSKSLQPKEILEHDEQNNKKESQFGPMAVPGDLVDFTIL